MVLAGETATAPRYSILLIWLRIARPRQVLPITPKQFANLRVRRNHSHAFSGFFALVRRNQVLHALRDKLDQPFVAFGSRATTCRNVGADLRDAAFNIRLFSAVRCLQAPGQRRASERTRVLAPGVAWLALTRMKSRPFVLFWLPARPSYLHCEFGPESSVHSRKNLHGRPDFRAATSRGFDHRSVHNSRVRHHVAARHVEKVSRVSARGRRTLPLHLAESSAGSGGKQAASAL